MNIEQPFLTHPDYEEPDWKILVKCHDWRRYVGDRTRNIWGSLDKGQKLAIALDAQDRADMEDWD